jgi:MOSC domain-containing protein YiiM
MKAHPGLPKQEVKQITLVEDHGVEGDYHAGKTIRHRYLAKKDPTRYNNRQVLLVDKVIHKLVKEGGIQLAPGDLGENILLDGIDLMSLPIDTQLRIGPALVELTEIREPCFQLDEVHPGLERAVEGDSSQGEEPRAGMLGVVRKGGLVSPGDEVRILLPFP